MLHLVYTLVNLIKPLDSLGSSAKLLLYYQTISTQPLSRGFFFFFFSRLRSDIPFAMINVLGMDKRKPALKKR